MREHGYLFLLLARNQTRAGRLLAACQQSLRVDERALVAHRYSTRTQLKPYEVRLTPAEFQARADAGCFVLDWVRDEVKLAVGVEVDRWLDGGLNVLLHGDSNVLDEAERRYGRYLRPVFSSKVSGRSWIERLLEARRRPAPQPQLGLSLDDTTTGVRRSASLHLTGELGDCAERLLGWLRHDQPPSFDTPR